MKDTFIHPTAIVDDGAVVEPGCRIWHFSHIMGGAVLGECCNIGQNVFIASGVRLGRNVKIQNNVSVYAGVICEDNVFLGPSCVFTNVKIREARYHGMTATQTQSCGMGRQSEPMPQLYVVWKSENTHL